LPDASRTPDIERLRYNCAPCHDSEGSGEGNERTAKDQSIRPRRDGIDTTALKVRPNTLDSYKQHVRDHIKPALGHIELKSLTTADVQRMISGLVDKGLRPRTVHRVHATLRAALNCARRWRMIQHNPAETALIDLPRAEPYEVNPLSVAEARAFLAAISGHRLETMYMVLFALGLRQGEVLGLRWQRTSIWTPAPWPCAGKCRTRPAARM
jgi:integrase